MSEDTPRRVFARGAALAFALHVAAMATSLVAQVAYARWMPQAAFGVYAQATAAMVVAANLLVIGVPMLNLQLLPVFVEGGDWAAARGLVRWGLRRVGALAGACGAAWALGAAVHGADPGWVAAGAVLVPTAVIGVQQTHALGFKRVGLARLPSEVGRPALALALFGLGMGIGLRPDALLAMVALLVSATLTAGVLSGRIAALFPAEARAHPPREDGPAWRERSFQFFGHGFFAMVLDRADLLVVGWWLGPRDAAVYAVVCALGKLLTFALAAVNTIAAPMVADLHARGRPAEVRDLLARGALASAGVAAAGGLALAAFAGPALSVFGDAYRAGAVALVVVLVGQAVNAGCGSAALVVSMAGHQRVTWRVVGLAAGLMLALDAVLVPWLGIEGAAVARSAAMAFWNVVLAAYATRALGYDPTLRAGLRLLRRG